MKILHVISAPAAGGAEIYVKDLAKTLTAQGHEISIGFVGHAVDIGRSHEFEEKFLSELTENDIEFFFIGNECRRNLWRGHRRVKKYIATRNIDVYHSHLFYGCLWGPFLGIPRIYTHHNSVARAPKPFFWLLNRLVDQYVGISETCSQLLRTYTGRQVELIENGVDKKKLGQCQLPTSYGESCFRLIAIGTLCEQKDYLNMLRAITLLPISSRNAIHLSICGEGPDKQVLDDFIAANDLENVVSLLGSRSDIPDLLANSHAFVMSSAWEGLPIALIEATLTGLPCIVTDVGGNSEVINKCQNGIVVPPHSPRELSNALQRLIDDKQCHAEFRKNSIKHGDAYSIEHASDAHCSLYQTVVDRQTKGSR